MKTDETVSFDYLNPDFSILKGRRIVFVSMPPECQFYFKHRIIHWINQVNEEIDPINNFDNINITRYLVGDGAHVSATFGVLNNEGKLDSSGTLDFNYNRDHEFVNYSVLTEFGFYANNLKFPNTSHLFRLEFTTQEAELTNYKLDRSFDMTETSIDDFMVQYCFDVNGKKISDFLVLWDYKNDVEWWVDDARLMNNDKFDDFFNLSIDTILISVNTFLELYPQFKTTEISTEENFQSFYAELRELYIQGVFNDGLKSNLDVVKMVNI